MITLLFTVFFALFGIYDVIDPIESPVTFAFGLVLGLGTCSLATVGAIYVQLRMWLVDA
jgi:hypothetical protein